MDRKGVVIGALSVWLLAGSGCAGLTAKNPFGEPGSSKPVAKKSSASSRTTTKSGAHRPGSAAPRSKTDSETVARSTKDSSSTAKAVATKSDSESHDALRDPQYRAVLDQELRDATPEERVAMMQVLQGKSPEVARDILKARRLSRNAIAQNSRPAQFPTKPNSEVAAAGAWSPARATTQLSGPLKPETSGREGSSTQQVGHTAALITPSSHSEPAIPVVTPRSAPLATQRGPTAPASSLSTQTAAALPPTGDLVPNQYQLQPGQQVAAKPPKPIADSAVVPTGGIQSPRISSTGMRAASATPVRTVSDQQKVKDLPRLEDVDPAATPEQPAPESLADAVGGAPTPQPPAQPFDTQPAAAPQSPLAQSPPPQSPVAQPTVEVAAPPQNWRQSPEFQHLVDLAAQEATAARMGPDGATDDYVRQHAHLRMLYLMAGQSDRAVESIPGIDAADQMFWQQTFWGMHNYFDTQSIPSADERATQTVQQFTNAAQRLQEKASLQLRNVAFCQQISSYGAYERFPQTEFTPGQQVLLYAEVDNFHSEETDNGQQFRTILKSTVEIYRSGLPTDPQKIELPVPATEDVCRNRRRDYFHTYEFVIPPRLQPGPHVLRLTVEDTLTRKIATATVNFTVK